MPTQQHLNYIRWMEEIPQQLIGGKHPIIYWASTIVLVAQEFAIIHSNYVTYHISINPWFLSPPHRLSWAGRSRWAPGPESWHASGLWPPVPMAQWRICGVFTGSVERKIDGKPWFSQSNIGCFFSVRPSNELFCFYHRRFISHFRLMYSLLTLKLGMVYGFAALGVYIQYVYIYNLCICKYIYICILHT